MSQQQRNWICGERECWLCRKVFYIGVFKWIHNLNLPKTISIDLYCFYLYTSAEFFWIHSRTYPNIFLYLRKLAFRKCTLHYLKSVEMMVNTEAVASVAWVLRGRRRTCKLAIQTKALIERSHSEGQIWKEEFIRLSVFLKNFSPWTRCTDWEHQGCFYKIPHKHRTFLRFSFLLVSGVCSVQRTTKTISCWLVDACARRSFEYKKSTTWPS